MKEQFEKNKKGLLLAIAMGCSDADRRAGRRNVFASDLAPYDCYHNLPPELKEKYREYAEAAIKAFEYIL